MMTAATMFFASSCSKEQISSNAPVGDQVTVTLTADLGAIESRAISDGLSVNEVAWAIYLHGSTTPLPDFQGVLPINGKEGKLEVRLVTGRSYDIALFAYHTENPTDKQVNVATPAPKYYVVDWSNNIVAVQYPNGPIANDDDARDCFWFVRENLEVNAPINETFTLNRPLAQLNFGVTAQDTADAAAAGLVVSQSKIKASTYTQFNVLTGKCTGDLVEYTFAQNDVPSQALKVGNVEYTYIGTAYLLVNDGEPLKDNVSITIYDNDANKTEINTLSYDNVPFKRNYRTNILGALLTNPIEFNIVVDERFNEPDFIVKHWDGTTKAVAEVNGTYTVTEPAELAWVAQQVNSGKNTFEGKAVVLQGEVIDLNGLNNQLWTPIGVSGKPFKGSFDGNGVVIRNMKVSTLECAGLFGNVLSSEGIKNVVLEDVVIESSHYAGAVVGYAYSDVINCSVDGLTLTVTPNDTTRAAYDNGDKVGGIAGYIAEKSGTAGYKINNNTVKNATITAYRDLGGVAGAAYIAECVGNKVENSVLTVDQTVNDYGEKDANLGQFVGRVLSGVVGDDNVATDVELVWNPETLKPATPISNITDKGNYIVKGIVSAVGTSAYFITDGTGALMVYGNKHNRVLGECVRIEGEVSRYSGYNTNAWQIKSTSTLVISEGNTPKYNPTVLTAADIDALVGQTATSTEVELVGTAYLSDKGYINIDIEGGNKDASLYYVAVDDYKHLVGANVTVKGYITGTYNYLNVLPYEVTDNKKATEWGVVGTANNWGATPDITMYTYDGNLMFAKGVEVVAGNEFKIRANNEWNDAKNYGMEVAQTVNNNMELPLICGGGAQNMKFLEDGVFDIYFDLANSKAYVMTAGKSIKDAADYEKYEEPIYHNHTWRIVGTFNEWNPGDDNYKMTLTDDNKWATTVAEFTKTEELKFVADNNWGINFGNGVTVELDTVYEGYQDGGNINVPAGKYEIYLSMIDGSFYMKEYVGAVEATITFDDKAKRTVFNTSQQVWVENGITVTNDKASSTSNVGDYAKPARFYKGSKVTIAAPGKIHSIKIDCTNMDAKYVTPWIASIGDNAVNENNIITVTLDGSSDSFVVAKTTAQIRANSMTITYAE